MKRLACRGLTLVELLVTLAIVALLVLASVPSFNGVWGFALARREAFDPPPYVPADAELRFLNDETLTAMFVLPRDLQPVEDVIVNRLDNQALVRYHETDWRRWAQQN